MQAVQKQAQATMRSTRCDVSRRAMFRPANSCHIQKPRVHCSISRRDGLAGIALAPVLLLSAESAKAETEASQQLTQYTDLQENFQLELPASWQQTEALIDGNRSFQGATGARRTLVWYPEDIPAEQVNITLTITNTGADYTKLGSFGNVYTFGQNLVNSMDRSFLLRVRGRPNPDEPIQIAKLLDAVETRGMYFVEYTVEKQPGPKRHLYSLVSLNYNGRYNRLYTLTAQCLEDQVGQAEPVLKQVLKSFVPPVSTA